MTSRRRFPKSPLRLRELYDLELLGNGPVATGGGLGWRMGQGNLFRCVECDCFLPDDVHESESCFCGRLHIDVGAGRFGSMLGDACIEVWRATSKGSRTE